MKNKTWLLAGILVIFLRGNSLISGISYDLQSLRASRVLFDQHVVPQCSTEVFNYPYLIACVESVVDNPSETQSALSLIEGWGKHHLERVHLLTVFSARVYDIDSPNKSCNLLSSIPAKPLILLLAEKARRDEDWNKLHIYLDCLDMIKSQPGSVSRYRVSALYNELGRYLEGNQNFERAKLAYVSASEWYPVVWADPVISIARLTANKTGTQEAAGIILTYLKKATLPQTIFLLNRELAFYQEQLGQLDLAYCSYLSAKKYGENLLEDYAPLPWKTQIDNRLLELQQILPISSLSCPDH